MALIKPTFTPIDGGPGQVVAWGPFGASDTAAPFELLGGEMVVGSLQAASTTLRPDGRFLQPIYLFVSNDGVNFHALRDVRQKSWDVNLDFPDLAEFSTTARFIKPTPAQGATVTLTIRR